jgi:peptidyl-prolyl cis-trans isomerase B (cyclophilin B)
MYRLIVLASITILSLQSAAAAEPEPAKMDPPRVILQTNAGAFTLELYAKDAPTTVANFLEYVRAEFYDGTIFHRVIADFMIQGGGFTDDMTRKTARPSIPNEADNGHTNVRGALAMARTGDPHSAGAQFFINLKDNDFLNHTAKDRRGWGYAVFGRVIDGMQTVDAIAASATGTVGGMRDVPLNPVIIESVREKFLPAPAE